MKKQMIITILMSLIGHVGIYGSAGSVVLTPVKYQLKPSGQPGAPVQGLWGSWRWPTKKSPVADVTISGLKGGKSVNWSFPEFIFASHQQKNDANNLVNYIIGTEWIVAETTEDQNSAPKLLKAMLTSTYTNKDGSSSEYTKYPVTMNQFRRMADLIINHYEAMEILMKILSGMDNDAIKKIQGNLVSKSETAKEAFKEGNLAQGAGNGLAAAGEALANVVTGTVRALDRVTQSFLTRGEQANKENDVLNALVRVGFKDSSGDVQNAIRDLAKIETSTNTGHGTTENVYNQKIYALHRLLADSLASKALKDMLKNEKIVELTQFTTNNMPAMFTLLKLARESINRYDDIVAFYDALDGIVSVPVTPKK